MYQSLNGCEIVKDGSSFYVLPLNASTIQPVSDEMRAAIDLLDHGLLDNLNVPGPSLQPTSVEELHANLCTLVAQYSNADRSQVELLSYAILASWVPERSPVSVLVKVTAPTHADLIPIARVLHAVCRYSILTDRPVLLNWPSPVTSILDASCCRDSHVFAYAGSSASSFRVSARCAAIQRGPVFILGSDFSDELAINIQLGDCSSRIPNEGELKRITETIHPRLLAHRRRMLLEEMDAPKPSPMVKSSAALQVQVLQAGTDCSEHQEEIVQLIKQSEGLFLDEIVLSVRGAVLECLLIASHNHPEVTCDILAKDAFELLHIRHETAKITARRVGSEVRQLGLKTRAIKGGRGIVFDPDVKWKIHQEAFAVDLPSTREQNTPCTVCDRFRATKGYVVQPKDAHDSNVSHVSDVDDVAVQGGDYEEKQ